MQVPIIQGVIDRRILVNYRVAPDVLAKILPPPFVPKLINGFGIAGICLIRLKDIRPRHLPRFIGLSSENAAHRIAVEWTINGKCQEGVYIPRRDTSSPLNTLIGGRLFPGVHHHSHFNVEENEKNFRIILTSNDESVSLEVEAEVGKNLPVTSIFKSINEASDFFESGALGYSPSQSDEFDGLELKTFNWKVSPLTVSHVHSSFFEDRNTFPEGSTEFDCALLMKGVNHEWHARESLCFGQSTAE